MAQASAADSRGLLAGHFLHVLFNLVGYAAISNVAVHAFNDFLACAFGICNLVAIEIGSWPYWAQLLTLFVVRDFVRWNVHRVPWLWAFHKVYYLVREMGFAAHLRYHFVEIVVCCSIEYLPLAVIGFGIQDFLPVRLFTFAVGHLKSCQHLLAFGAVEISLQQPADAHLAPRQALARG